MVDMIVGESSQQTDDVSPDRPGRRAADRGAASDDGTPEPWPVPACSGEGPPRLVRPPHPPSGAEIPSGCRRREVPTAQCACIHQRMRPVSSVLARAGRNSAALACHLSRVGDNQRVLHASVGAGGPQMPSSAVRLCGLSAGHVGATLAVSHILTPLQLSTLDETVVSHRVICGHHFFHPHVSSSHQTYSLASLESGPGGGFLINHRIISSDTLA